MARFRLSVRGLMVVAPLGGLFCGWLGLVVPRAIESRTESRCAANLAAIGIAMNEYHAKYGHFPPAWLADPEGRPTHSWRVLLLEFLDPDLFRQYDFAESWDGPKNRRLAPKRPAVYACPDLQDSQHSPRTGYAVIVGPESVFTGDLPVSVSQISDGTEGTILVAEIARVEIPWMEPRDLRMDRMAFTIDDPELPCLSGSHGHGAGILLANGRTKHLPPGTSARRVRESITKAGLSVLKLRPG